MKHPHESHLKEPKRILQYICGTVPFEIHYSIGVAQLLMCFTDSDLASNLDDQKSTAGYVFTLGSRPITLACK